MGYKEFTGKTVDDALTEASINLGVTSDEIVYEVIEQGSNGILGFGSKNAVIKACLKSEVESVKAEEAAAATEVVKEEAPKSEASKKVEKVLDPNFDPEATVKDFLSQVFEKMNLEVTITTTFNAEEGEVSVDLAGAEMGVLIGKRGQTLDSLQYLTNLALNRKSDNYLRVKIDTEDYRNRRKKTLENLAVNTAYKVKRSRHAVSLEAMNPYERRIIHSALQNDDAVETHSEGEEPFRHVVITLKK